MCNIIELEFSKAQVIQIHLPCEIKNVKSFDNVSIKYIKGSIEYDLFVNDFISEAIKTLNYFLNKALHFELKIKGEYKEKGIGYYHNIYSHELWTNDDLDIIDPAEDFLVWSTPSHIGIETYMYNFQDKIYIEVSPVYKWNSDYPDDEKEYETFEKFINQYQVIDVINVNRDILLQWQKICLEILEIAALNDRKKF
ncbi:hypothetical protein WAZ07_21995 [Bacillus sp. FJAT-51639]|uniref:DUF402 domain-containing protein n=1 Tax=Bacillus bruguierae TaxID=3127667 RepID=A0ABU8FMV1_9BACI